ncbi:hypothetical protein ACLB1M_16250 [Escherichia coli]
MASLRKLNQFRTFARGFDNVRQGDELDVPAQVSENNLTPPPGNSSGNLERQIASTSQQIGSLLAEDMNSEQAANMASMGLFSGFRRNDRLVKPLRYRKNHAGRG